MKKAVERDRSRVSVSELSNQGLMEITRKRVCMYVCLHFYLTFSCWMNTSLHDVLNIHALRAMID